MDVRFDEFMADDLGTASRLYELAGQPLDARARAAHAEYLAGHRRDRHGRVLHDADAVGVDLDAVREATAEYSDAFGV